MRSRPRWSCTSAFRGGATAGRGCAVQRPAWFRGDYRDNTRFEPRPRAISLRTFAIWVTGSGTRRSSAIRSPKALDHGCTNELSVSHRVQSAIFLVDAFAHEPMTGNPAGVCPLSYWLPEPTMQLLLLNLIKPKRPFLFQKVMTFAYDGSLEPARLTTSAMQPWRQATLSCRLSVPILPKYDF